MAIWQEPKTDWTVEDRINFKDYNRIRNNILYVYNEAVDMFGNFDIEDMGEEMESYEENWKVQYFNAFESNIDIINKHMMSKDYGFKQTFYPNGIFIGYAELNRIEGAIRGMKGTIDGIIAGRRRLPFRLGYPKGLAV